jgi:hypothetical protein
MVDDDDGGGLREQLRRHEAEIILRALRRAGWNQTEAARYLKVPRRTLVYKLRALGITRLGYATSDAAAAPVPSTPAARSLRSRRPTPIRNERDITGGFPR